MSERDEFHVSMTRLAEQLSDRLQRILDAADTTEPEVVYHELMHLSQQMIGLARLMLEAGKKAHEIAESIWQPPESAGEQPGKPGA